MSPAWVEDLDPTRQRILVQLSRMADPYSGLHLPHSVRQILDRLPARQRRGALQVLVDDHFEGGRRTERQLLGLLKS